MIGYLLNKLRCLSHNRLEDNEFKMRYRHGVFEIDLAGVGMKFHQNPFWDLVVSLRGYLARYRPRAGDCIVDAGAYVGVFTILASKFAGPDGQVLAFEPDSENYRHLMANIELNDARNVTAIPKGLWSGQAAVKFSNTHDPTSAIILPGQAAGAAVEISAVALDDELERLGISKVDFIKMDIEGAELEAIKGCRRMLQEGHVKLAIASYHMVGGEETRFALDRILTAAGFQVESSFPQHVTTYASK